MDTAKIIRMAKTPVTLLALIALVVFGFNWGLKAATAPVPPIPPDPCVMTKVGEKLTPDLITIRVFNGTTTDGLAKRYAANLRAEGFIRVVKTSNHDTSDVTASRLVGFAVDSPEVVLLRKAFKDIEVVADGRVDHSVDFIIGTEFHGWAENPDLTVDIPSGEVCLPKLRSTTEIE